MLQFALDCWSYLGGEVRLELQVSLCSQWLSQVSLATSVSLCLTIQAKQRPNKQRIVSRTDQASFVHLSLPAPPPPVDQ